MNTPTPIDSNPIEENPLRDKRGRFLRKPDYLPVLTSAKAKEAAEIRWRNYRAKASSAVLREAAAIDPSVKTKSDAWGLLVSRQYTALLDSDKPRGDDLYRIGQVIGALPLQHETRMVEEQVNSAPALVDAVSSIIRAVLDVVERRDIVEAQVSDVGQD